MKIAILAQTFPPRWMGGMEIATHNIASHLVGMGNEVHVITSISKNLPRECVNNGFFVHRVQTIRKQVLFGLSHNLMSLPVIKRIDPDIVFCQYVSCGLAGFLAKKLWKKSYIISGQGSDVYLSWAFKNAISKLVLNHADAVIALTEDMKLAMQKICNREIIIVSNGVDLNKFEGLSEKKALRNYLGYGQDEKIILFVGRLSPVKGVRYLIEAMSCIVDKKYDISLKLVGDGNDRRHLENIVKELNLVKFVTFVGKVQNEEVPLYMASSDIFVLPSLSEGFPLVIMEAMAAGLPIVATNIRGISEIVLNEENGFIVDPEKPQQIADKLQLLLDNADLSIKISSNNKEKVKGYSWERITESIGEICYSILLRH